MSRHTIARPDLSDDLTRLGLLAVVRRVRVEPFAYVGASILNGDGSVRVWSYCPMGLGRAAFYGPTEADAILAALEAAP